MKFISCGKYKVARKMYPYAVKIVRVTDGYMVFFNWSDYSTWKNQKQVKEVIIMKDKVNNIIGFTVIVAWTVFGIALIFCLQGTKGV